jgi:hypothetical protein
MVSPDGQPAPLGLLPDRNMRDAVTLALLE